MLGAIPLGVTALRNPYQTGRFRSPLISPPYCGALSGFRFRENQHTSFNNANNRWYF